MSPRAVKLRLPAEYGSSRRTLAWADVQRQLTDAPRYWLATTRPDGRPHTVPVDGVWMDDACWFGGSPRTVHHRNLVASPAAVMHLEDGARAVIVEGSARWVTPERDHAVRLADASNAKTGYGSPVEMFESGLWRLEPVRVLAWNAFPSDATRFSFG